WATGPSSAAVRAESAAAWPWRLPRLSIRKGRKPMSDHLLSQDEIDALLKGASAAPEEPAGDEQERLAELYQRALMRLAPLLPSLAGKTLRDPSVEGRWSSWGEVRRQVSSPLVARCDFTG